MAGKALRRVGHLQGLLDGPLVKTILQKLPAHDLNGARFTRLLAPLKEIIIEYKKIVSVVDAETLANYPEFIKVEAQLASYEQLVLEQSRANHTAWGARMYHKSVILVAQTSCT